jgi:hypothetical protein
MKYPDGGGLTAAGLTQRAGARRCGFKDQLTAIIKNRLKSIQYRPALIDAFLAQTGLTLEPELP